jgi:hypothetical protein
MFSTQFGVNSRSVILQVKKLNDLNALVKFTGCFRRGSLCDQSEQLTAMLGGQYEEEEEEGETSRSSSRNSAIGSHQTQYACTGWSLYRYENIIFSPYKYENPPRAVPSSGPSFSFSPLLPIFPFHL